MSTPRDPRKRRSMREQNIADFGDSYGHFERMVRLGTLPPWPIRQCLSKSKTTGVRCRQQFGQPGQTLCRWHFGTTKAERKRAIRRYVTWILCGFPTAEPMVLELLLTEVIAHRLESARFYAEVPMVEQVKFISDVLTFAGVVEGSGDDHG